MDMRKLILLSAVMGPLLLGVLAAADPRPRRGLARLVASVAVLELVYGLLLYYVWLRLSD
jgi:hypothetical protein